MPGTGIQETQSLPSSGSFSSQGDKESRLLERENVPPSRSQHNTSNQKHGAREEPRQSKNLLEPRQTLARAVARLRPEGEVFGLQPISTNHVLLIPSLSLCPAHPWLLRSSSLTKALPTSVPSAHLGSHLITLITLLNCIYPFLLASSGGLV